MKIYTKGGDNGSTSLIGGKRVQKSDIRIEAYGTVDELIADIGLLRDQAINRELIKKLIGIQDTLMVCASILASDCDNCESIIPGLKETEIHFLENEIDEMESKLPGLTSFILPGGHPAVSICHIARTVCRRAERRTVELNRNNIVPSNVIMYLNRLSDYLFVLSRFLAADFQVNEIKWTPNVD